MSRFWNKQDELYIYKENLRIKKEETESLIHRINTNIKYELNLTNIMDIYEAKINEYILYLQSENIDYFSPQYSKKNFIYEKLDVYLKRGINELIHINNKLINPKYESIINSKLILLLIRKNLNKYNSIIMEIKELDLSNMY